MSETLQKYAKFPLLAVVFTVLVKLLFLLTHHIQEDAFITWRVAQNLLDYGVIGFNGETKISDRKSTRLNSSHLKLSRMPSSA